MFVFVCCREPADCFQIAFTALLHPLTALLHFHADSAVHFKSQTGGQLQQLDMDVVADIDHGQSMAGGQVDYYVSNKR